MIARAKMLCMMNASQVKAQNYSVDKTDSFSLSEGIEYLCGLC